jgi:hypothetical protein
LDAEVLPQPLHVGEQVLGGVVAHVGGGIAGMRRAAPASALVEQDDPVAIRIEVLASARLASPAGAAVHEQGGLPSGLPQASQYTRLPSPTSSIPWSYGSIGGYNGSAMSLIPFVSTIQRDAAADWALLMWNGLSGERSA